VHQLAIKGVPRSSSKHREITYHCCCCVLLYFLRESLRAQNSREQAYEISSSCDTCTGRRAIKFLGSATLRDCSLVRATTFWWCKLLYHYFQKAVGCHYFHSSCIKLDRLLQVAQHVDCWERHHQSLRHWSCLWV
jgi:hypothetical protein